MNKPTPSFQYVKPTDEQIATMQIYRDKFEQLATEICNDPNVPAGRGRASAMTKLEECAFWLNKGITLND